MGIIFLCLLYRLLVHYQLNRINTKRTSILFQTKLNHFKQRELQKSFTYLFAGTLGLISVLFFSVILLFQLETQVHGLSTDNRSLQGQIKKIKTKKSTGNLLKEYPTSGLNLKASLAANNVTVEGKEQNEKDISNQLSPYIEKANLVLSSSSEADSLSVLLTGTIEGTNANLVILGQNIVELMLEIEGIKKISEVHISIDDHEGNDLYKGTYFRNETGQFTFQSEMRKGKG